MGMGQTIIAVGVLVLVSIAILSMNRLVTDKDQQYYDKKAIEQSAILANALLDEISRKKFDSTVDTAYVGYKASSTFDASGSLGPSAAASNYVNPSGNPDSYVPHRSVTPLYFDDVDDYKGYVRTDSSGSLLGFRLWVDVNYVTTSGTVTSSRTYYKKVDVYVSNTRYMFDTLTFSRIIAY